MDEGVFFECLKAGVGDVVRCTRSETDSFFVDDLYTVVPEYTSLSRVRRESVIGVRFSSMSRFVMHRRSGETVEEEMNFKTFMKRMDKV